MSFLLRLLETIAPARPAAPSARPFAPRALEDALASLGHVRQRAFRAQRLRPPQPPPGVVPKGAPTLAADAQIAALASYAARCDWDGHGFMGHALLSELAQIPEYRRPSEILANEMTRKWIRFASSSRQDKTDKIKAIEEELRRIGAREAFRRAFELDNFFGHGLIYLDLGVSGAELATPLALAAKVGRGALKGLRAIEPIWAYPGAVNASDPLAADFYAPQSWFVMGAQVHRSRLLSFICRPAPDMLKPAYLFGGVSLTQLLRPYVDNWLRTRQAVSDITHNFSTPVMKTDMGQVLAPGAAQALALRAEVFNVGRDNQGLMIFDKDKEDFLNVAAPLGGLDKLQAQAQEQMAAAAGVPLVKLFGVTPSGLNASSDGEVRVFYDTIESLQERTGTPAMRQLLDIVQMSLFGAIDPDISFAWRPLWSLDEEKLANVRKADAQTDCAYLAQGVVTPAELRKTLSSDETSRYASLEAQ